MIDDGIDARRVVDWKAVRGRLLVAARRTVANHSDLPSLLDLCAVCFFGVFMTMAPSYRAEWAGFALRACYATLLTGYCVRFHRWYLRRQERATVNAGGAPKQAAPAATGQTAVDGADPSITASGSRAAAQVAPVGPRELMVKQYAAGRAWAWCTGDSAYAKHAEDALRRAMRIRVDMDLELFESEMRQHQFPEEVIAEYLQRVQWEDGVWLQTGYPT